MISYMCKRINGQIKLKRWIKVRTSDKRKRIDAEMKNLRKTWWHFKTRWERKDESTFETE